MQTAIISGGRRSARRSISPTEEEKLERFSGPENGGEETADELDRLRKDRLNYVYSLDSYKRKLTYAVIAALFSCVIAVVVIAWQFSEVEPTYEELRAKILSTSRESPRLCVTLYPNSIKKDFEGLPEVGQPLTLTPYIEEGEYAKAAEFSSVKTVLQSENSFAGFFTVNKTTNSNLFFWFFPTKSNAAHAPLLLWLQGGPGWPTMYGLFKENGPYLAGWDSNTEKTFLLPNRHSWNSNHNMLYIDNPVGTGFSFTDKEEGFPTTDEQVAVDLMEAIRQFMLVLPEFVPGAQSSSIPFYAFGESYGGAYVISLSHVYLQYRENDPSSVSNLNFMGIGIGNGFVSAEHQSKYADYIRSLSFLTEVQYTELSERDNALQSALNNKNYAEALECSQKSLHYIVAEVMNLTNIYDFSFDENYLTNHEYVCFLQQTRVRKAIHVGALPFNSGFESYNYLNETIMVSKLPWLEETLERGIEVLIYNGNLDIIVNIPGVNRVLDALSWSGRGEFVKSRRKDFWVWNEETERGELAGYINEGGGLTFALMRNSGHMVPISQPLRAMDLVSRFTHHKKGGERFKVPDQLHKTLEGSNSFFNCEN